MAPDAKGLRWEVAGASKRFNKLLKQFDDMKKMMKQFSGGGNPLKMLKNMPQGGIPR